MWSYQRSNHQSVDSQQWLQHSDALVRVNALLAHILPLMVLVCTFFNHHTYQLLTQQTHHSILPFELPLAADNHFFTLSSGPSVPAWTIHTPLSHCLISESAPSLPTTLPPVNYSLFDLPVSSCFLSHHASLNLIKRHLLIQSASSSLLLMWPMWVCG